MKNLKLFSEFLNETVSSAPQNTKGFSPRPDAKNLKGPFVYCLNDPRKMKIGETPGDPKVIGGNVGFGDELFYIDNKEITFKKPFGHARNGNTITRTFNSGPYSIKMTYNPMDNEIEGEIILSVNSKPIFKSTFAIVEKYDFDTTMDDLELNKPKPGDKPKTNPVPSDVPMYLSSIKKINPGVVIKKSNIDALVRAGLWTMVVNTDNNQAYIDKEKKLRVVMDSSKEPQEVLWIDDWDGNSDFEIPEGF